MISESFQANVSCNEAKSSRLGKQMAGNYFHHRGSGNITSRDFTCQLNDEPLRTTRWRMANRRERGMIETAGTATEDKQVAADLDRRHGYRGNFSPRWKLHAPFECLARSQAALDRWGAEVYAIAALQIHLYPIIIKIFEILLGLFQPAFTVWIVHGDPIPLQRNSHQCRSVAIVQDSSPRRGESGRCCKGPGILPESWRLTLPRTSKRSISSGENRRSIWLPVQVMVVRAAEPRSNSPTNRENENFIFVGGRRRALDQVGSAYEFQVEGGKPELLERLAEGPQFASKIAGILYVRLVGVAQESCCLQRQQSYFWRGFAS